MSSASFLWLTTDTFFFDFGDPLSLKMEMFLTWQGSTNKYCYKLLRVKARYKQLPDNDPELKNKNKGNSKKIIPSIIYKRTCICKNSIWFINTQDTLMCYGIKKINRFPEFG